MGRSSLNPAAKAFVPPSFAAKQQVTLWIPNTTHDTGHQQYPPARSVHSRLNERDHTQGNLGGSDAPAGGPAAPRETYSSHSAARAWKRATASPAHSPRPSVSGDRRRLDGALFRDSDKADIASLTRADDVSTRPRSRRRAERRAVQVAVLGADLGTSRHIVTYAVRSSITLCICYRHALLIFNAKQLL